MKHIAVFAVVVALCATSAQAQTRTVIVSGTPTTVRFIAQPLPACNTLSAGLVVRSDSDGNLYECENDTWYRVSPPSYTDLQATLLGRDLSLNTAVLTQANPTGDTLTILNGRLRLAPFDVNQNAWIAYDVSLGLVFGQQMNNCAGCSLMTDVIWPRQGTASVQIQGAHGLTLVPQSAVDSCTSDKKGQLTTLTSDGRLYQCNGTSSQTFGYRKSWSGSLDFGAISATSCSSLTISATGAVANESVACGGCGSVMNADASLTCGCAVTSTDTLTVRLCCNSGSSCADPSAITFTATAIR